MTERKDVTKRESKTQPQATESERSIRPPVDIFEDDTGITVQADLPGVSRERLNIQVDKDTLSIEGEASIDMPKGMDALYADVSSTHYRRSFSLSSELDAEKVDANLKDGVLTLRISKRKEHLPRKIEVRTG